jgi:uncharacterized protein YrrD
MWLITYYDDKMKIQTYKSDYNGSILGAINDFYAKFKYRSILAISWND